MPIGAEPLGGHLLADRLLHASGAGHFDAVSVSEGLELAAGTEGRESSRLVIVAVEVRLDVGLFVDDLGEDTGAVILGELLVEVRGKEKSFLRVMFGKTGPFSAANAAERRAGHCTPGPLAVSM